ncbi:MAG TPA: hypothetical protein VG755_11045 [Nannocystaceae bacterium]|nr:hypothetical protein [Nannocystaceae bacterium]
MFVPSGEGRAALAELDHVAWAELHHAYGRGVTGPGETHDVRAALALLGHDGEAISSAVYALFSNVCHQGTIYEATAHAVPFIAAAASDDAVWVGHARELLCLLGAIAIASSFETDDGTMSGSFGDDVAESTRAALRASAPRLRTAASVHATQAELTNSIIALASSDPPTRAGMDAVSSAMATATRVELGDPPRPPLPERWVTHTKFGRGLVIARSDDKSRVRFDDGSERVLLDRVLADCDPEG